MKTERLLTTREAAELLKLSAATLEQWRHRGKGPDYVRLGTRMIRYRPSDIECFIKDS